MYLFVFLFLSSIKKEKGYNFLISVDGGVGGSNAQTLVDAGADVLATGSAFFKDPSWTAQISKTL